MCIIEDMKNLFRIVPILFFSTIAMMAASSQNQAIIEGSLTVDYVRSVRGFTVVAKTSSCDVSSILLKAVIWREDMPQSDPTAWRTVYKSLPRGSVSCSDTPVSWTFEVLEAEKVRQLVVIENVPKNKAVAFPE